jgi:hypothetical protein
LSEVVKDVLKDTTSRVRQSPLLDGTVTEEFGVGVRDAAVALFFERDVVAAVPLQKLHADGRLASTDEEGRFSLAGAGNGDASLTRPTLRRCFWDRV